MKIDRVIAKGQLVGLRFEQDNLAASQTDAALTVSEVASAAGNAVSGISVPFNGEIVAVSYDTSAAATAGTLTITATVGGTKKTATAQTVTTATGGYGRIARGSVPLVAGNVVGVKITTDGSWDATTADLAVTVWVLLALEGI